MLDFLEAMGRLFMGVLRVLDFLNEAISIIQGMRWLFSPSYREEVRRESRATRYWVYAGVAMALLILAGVAVLIGFASKARLGG